MSNYDTALVELSNLEYLSRHLHVHVASIGPLWWRKYHRGPHSSLIFACREVELVSGNVWIWFYGPDKRTGYRTSQLMHKASQLAGDSIPLTVGEVIASELSGILELPAAQAIEVPADMR